MCYVVQSLGKTSVTDLARTDLVSLTPHLATFVAIPFVGARAYETVEHEAVSGPPTPRRQKADRPEHRVH